MIARKRCIVIKYDKDTRYSEERAATHDGATLAARRVSRLSELEDDWRSFDVLALDEAQFFPDVVSFAEDAATSGKVVVVCGLDGTFQRKVRQLVIMLQYHEFLEHA